jgi:DNA-binding LytR/AlgR family response regulator
MLASAGRPASLPALDPSVAQGRSVRLIPVNDVCYFQADNKYTLGRHGDDQSLINKPIKELIDALDPETFLQVHRGTVVNVNAIAAVSRDLAGAWKSSSSSARIVARQRIVSRISLRQM